VGTDRDAETGPAGAPTDVSHPAGRPGRSEASTVGLVLVSHSARLAEGAADLARAMAGEEVRIVPAGGMAPPEEGLGTDATRVAAAIDEAWSEAGVLVLMDLGSALLSGEMALDFLAPGRRDRVTLSAAPLVEGAVAAAVAARMGEPLARVAAEAAGSLEAKRAMVSGPGGTATTSERRAAPAPGGGSADSPGPGAEMRVTVDLPLGLHARPAARLVRATAGLTADVAAANGTTGSDLVSARSLNALASLQVRRGQELVVRASGPDAEAAITAVRALAARRFDEPISAAAAASDGAGSPVSPAADGGAGPPGPGREAATAGSPASGSELQGVPASPGIAAGVLRVMEQAELPIPAGAAQDPGEELAKLGTAISGTRAELEALREQTRARAGDYQAEIIDADLLFLDDPALLEPTRAAIRGEHRTAAQAWSEVAARLRQTWEALEDPNLRLRAADLDGVSRRVLERLLGRHGSVLREAGILIAADLAPTDTAALDPRLVLGIATAGGGPTSHSAIMARSLGVPAVVGLGDRLLSLGSGRSALLDGHRGTLTLDPSPEACRQARSEVRRRARSAARAAAAAARPARTRDGVLVEVAANLGSVEEATRAAEAGADAVGLLRTEFLFLTAAAMPDEAAQTRAYSEIARRLEGRPLTIRTLDVGADKPLPYLRSVAEDNPALGLRGIRLGLSRPEVLLTQLRAVVATARSFPVRVMFPMVASLAEVTRARAILDEALGSEPVPLQVGVMIEVPSAALTARLLAAHVDFLSVGTNDLSQYALAADRGNAEVATLADAHHPAVLRLIAEAVRGAAGRAWVGVCGELAGELDAVPLLIGLGVRELSVAVPAIARVKEAVRAVDTAECARLARAAIRLADGAAVRRLLARPG
jgi:phosphoenolpyruvate-protein phosphotransferase/dihydroxyacetone kinase phosphotransfer subunit